MKKRSAKRIQKQQQITDEEKQLLDLMASLIVEIILRENVDQVFDIGVETESKPKWLIISFCSNIPVLVWSEGRTPKFSLIY